MAVEPKTCMFKLGPAPACGEPATGVVHLSLPQWVAEGVMIAEDQRETDLDVCPDHERFIENLHAPNDLFSVRRPPAATRDDLPIEGDHREHTAYVLNCLGCALDFDPPW